MSSLILNNDINTKMKKIKHPGFPGCIYLKPINHSKEVPLATIISKTRLMDYLHVTMAIV